MLSCFNKKLLTTNLTNKSNHVVLEYLSEIEGIDFCDKPVYIYRGFNSEINANIYRNRYFDNSIKMDSTISTDWIDKDINDICKCNQNLFISINDFSYTHFDKQDVVFRFSDIYFVSNTAGFFIASKVCGQNCEIANIYTFTFDNENKCKITLASYYYIN